MIHSLNCIALNTVKYLLKLSKRQKKAYYDSTILKSHNKIKTTWSIVKKETGYKIYKDELKALKINNTTINNKEHIANAFNEYFTSVAQTIIDDLNKDNNKILTYQPIILSKQYVQFYL
jgi:hypothetical protein